MVFIMNSTKISQIESNIRYLVELDINEEVSYDDCLGMAFYYHYLHENRIPGVNYSKLYNWCRSFCYDVIKNRNISRIRDNEITSSLLIFSSIKDDAGFDKQRASEVKEEIPKLLEEEMCNAPH